MVGVVVWRERRRGCEDARMPVVGCGRVGRVGVRDMMACMVWRGGCFIYVHAVRTYGRWRQRDNDVVPLPSHPGDPARSICMHSEF